ncbi:MAG: pyruvate kinase [Acidimicrobiales bacterium]
MSRRECTSDLAELERDLLDLRSSLARAVVEQADAIARVHPSHRSSAANLVQYVELRRRDARGLQARLAAHGLSSLGRSESHVLDAVETVLGVVARLRGHDAPPATAPIDLLGGHSRLEVNTTALLGPPPPHRTTRIMVTMPGDAADDPHLVDRLADEGMDLARINCAHDDPATWAAIAARVREATTTNGRRPRVAMDLAGPKLRTGPILPAPGVVRVSPTRDRYGRVTSPALVRLVGTEAPEPGPADPASVVPLDDSSWIRRRTVGERISFVDARGAERHWDVVDSDAAVCTVTGTTTSYLTAGTALVVGEDHVHVAPLPPAEQWHRVQHHDRIVLLRHDRPTAPVSPGGPHEVSCTLPEALDHVHLGDRVWFDDGKIGGIVSDVGAAGVEIRVTDVRPGGAKLRADKGINLPDSDLDLGALTPQDLADLDAVVEHADFVNLSFVRRPSDVAELRARLADHGADDIGIVLKIENRAAFERLPDLLLEAMVGPVVGVMIARGDLAVELGFERLAEVQEEILWVCEAAHVPVIWATQVLDTMARTGRPSRAEITDAAMAERAECVMLNKGPSVVHAVRVLDSVITRMQDHQHKKRSLLRRLRAWEQLGAEVG